MNEELLIRFLTHACTSKDMQKVDKWISQDKAKATWLFDMEEIWGLKKELEASDRKNIEKAYARFKQNNALSHQSNRILLHKSMIFLKYAAIAIVVSLLGINLYKISHKPAVYSELEIPKGQYLSLTLSDGTKVWLNSESKLKYPAEFNSDQRLVTLEGEGYFEVTHNKKVPFIVESSLLKVKVLGTKFNMRAYKDEDRATVSLTEGSVEVESNDHVSLMRMRPNDKLSYDKKNGMNLSSNYNVDANISWTKGELEFEETRLEDICCQLERKFNVSINIKDNELKHEKFTCHYKEGVPIREILELLKETKRLDFTINENNIEIIKSDMPMKNTK